MVEADLHRPGYARRTPEFLKVLDRAETFIPADMISQAEINRSILYGTPDLSLTQRMYLLYAVSFLSHEKIQKGDAFFYMGTYQLSECMGSEGKPFCKRSLSRIKASLEAKGYIIRHFDQRNRPLEKGGIDLRPLLSRLEEFQEIVEDRFESARDYFENLRSLDGYDHTNKDDKRVRGGRLLSHPNRLNPTKLDKTVQTSEVNAELSASQPISNTLSDQQDADQKEITKDLPVNTSKTPSSSICSPKGASVFWRGFDKSSKQRHLKAVCEMKEALELSEQLQSYIPLSSVEASDEDAILDGCYRFIEENFSEKRNTDQTFSWAVNKFGWRSVLLLICAIEDNTIMSREGWIGHMTTKSKRTLRLGGNFQRIRRQRELTLKENSPLTANSSLYDDYNPLQIDTTLKEDKLTAEASLIEALPVEPDPYQELWLELKEHLLAEELMSEAEIRSWIDPTRITSHNPSGIILGVNTGFQRDYIETTFRPILEDAFALLLDKKIGLKIEIQPERKKH